MLIFKMFTLDNHVLGASIKNGLIMRTKRINNLNQLACI
jgi:hypothetical protein